MGATGIVFTEEFIPILEEPLHREPSPKYIFRQFVMEEFDFVTRKGEESKIAGPVFLDPVTNARTERKLTNLSSKVADQTVQNFDINYQSISMNEYLLKNPLQLQEYDVKHSQHDLARINGGILAEDYFSWEDTFVRQCMTDSTFVHYAGNNTSSTIDVNDLVTMQQVVLNGALLHNRHIPTYPDGTYMCLIDPSTRATLFVDQDLLDSTSRALQGKAFIYAGEIGEFAKIRFLCTDNLPRVTLGASGSTFSASQCLLFGTSTFRQQPLGTEEQMISSDRNKWLNGQGAGPVVRLVGMPVEVRPHEITDFGRFSTVIWITHGEYSVLDPGVTAYDATKTVGTDTRFIQKFYGSTVVAQMEEA